MISPWIIYLMGAIGSAKIASVTLGLFCTLAYVFESLIVEGLWVNRRQKRMLLVIGICFLLAIFLPSKETMYAMLGASLTTPENIEAVKSFSVDTIEQITEAVASGVEKGMSK